MQKPDPASGSVKAGRIPLIPVPGWSPDEMRPPETGDARLDAALWQSARDVALWGQAAPQNRAGLFDPSGSLSLRSAALDPYAQPLSVIERLREDPAAAPAAVVGEACSRVVFVAESTGNLALARLFAEAWAYAEQDSARAAATAGQLCTRLAEYPRAEIWLQRAVRLARISRDWEWYVRGYLRLGILKFNLGIYPTAKRYYLRAYRMAVWAGRWSLAGKARHDLMTICTDLRDIQRGIEHAEAVYRYYPINDPVFPYFVHDFAFLLVQGGYHEPAFRLLTSALDFIPAHRQLLIRGTLARAAAALRDRELYDELTAQVEALAAESQEGAAAAFVRVADGAREFGEWERAELFAGRGLEIAHARHEGQPQRLAHEILDLVSIRDRNPNPPVPVTHDVASLTARILKRLAKHRAPADVAGALTKIP